MARAAALALALGLAAAGQGRAEEERLTLPSGLEARLQEMLWDRPGSGLVYRFRFVAPGFSSTATDIDAVGTDLEYLCQEVALPRLSEIGPKPSRIVISLADRESEFGTIDADVDQVFEVFSVHEGACIWEMF